MSKVSLLSAIVTGDCSSRFTCIQDSLEQSGRNLLQAFAQNAINNECTVHILCTEHPVDKFKNSLRNNNSSNVHFHDCFSDHQCWIKHYNSEDVSELSITNLVGDAIRGRCVIIVESLTPYVLNNGFVKCCQEFSRLLLRTEVEIVCLVHEDTLPSADRHLPQLAYLATTYITLRVPAVAHIVYKKPGGKIIKQAEEFAVSSENKVISQVVKPSEVSVVMKNEEVVVPDELTTFKLSLGQQEKEARSQLILPYIRKEENTGGVVYYQPDAADDWDEEDPDDDLDI